MPVVNKGYTHLAIFDDEWKARTYCRIKNSAGGRVFAVCRSMSTGKWWVVDMLTAIRLGDWWGIEV